ncbi:MAG: hypothetical protein K2X47_05870, partial [Bdellovibrionales bacterium]|nr:hypothetical protein [Bdellovibrionales bacterium]
NLRSGHPMKVSRFLKGDQKPFSVKTLKFAYRPYSDAKELIGVYSTKGLCSPFTEEFNAVVRGAQVQHSDATKIQAGKEKTCRIYPEGTNSGNRIPNEHQNPPAQKSPGL